MVEVMRRFSAFFSLCLMSAAGTGNTLPDDYLQNWEVPASLKSVSPPCDACLLGVEGAMGYLVQNFKSNREKYKKSGSKAGVFKFDKKVYAKMPAEICTSKIRHMPFAKAVNDSCFKIFENGGNRKALVGLLSKSNKQRAAQKKKGFDLYGVKAAFCGTKTSLCTGAEVDPVLALWPKYTMSTGDLSPCGACMNLVSDLLTYTRRYERGSTKSTRRTLMSLLLEHIACQQLTKLGMHNITDAYETKSILACEDVRDKLLDRNQNLFFKVMANSKQLPQVVTAIDAVCGTGKGAFCGSETAELAPGDIVTSKGERNIEL